MNSQFGLTHVWTQGDWVTRSTAIILLAMSLASWFVMVMKALDLVRLRKLAAQVEAFWHSPDFEHGLKALDPQANPFRQMAIDGRDAVAHHHGSSGRHLHGTLDLSDWVTRTLRNAMDDTLSQMQRGLAILASVGSTAPFVGLFGTVWGIYHALIAIGLAGQASIDKVAGPIGEALIMTALGLAVAIPAVLGYNALVRGNKAVAAKLSRFAHDLHAYLVTGGRVQTGEAKVIPLKQG
jgi:biopolymer transport protein ExbB